tara:strand:- start:620 stop:781 length:162 start_codon:yes stop_codon:yes gene_type:complete
MTTNIPDIKVPIIKNGVTKIISLKEEFKNKKIIYLESLVHLRQLVLKNIFLDT